MSEFINRQEENNKPGEDDRKLKHTGTEGTSVLTDGMTWFNGDYF